MNPLKLTFTANEQALTKTDNFTDFASNTVSYIEATFTLGENWTGYDSVRAVWKTDYYTISTVLDANFTCIVPTEVLRYKAKVFVNLVGSIVENDTLTDRLTTFPVLALTVKANAAVNGSETAPVTPSQFEQFVDSVRDAAGSISDYSYDSEAWAVGTRGGVNVPSTDPTFHNNSKYWAEQNAGLADEVADLKEDISDITQVHYGKNRLDISAVVSGYLGSDGSIISNASWVTTDYCYVKGFENIIGSSDNGQGARVNLTLFYLCTYKEDKTFIEQKWTTGSYKASLDSDVAYVRFSIDVSNVDDYPMLEEGDTRTDYVPFSIKTSVITDKTLTKDNVPADAKTVGGKVQQSVNFAPSALTMTQEKLLNATTGAITTASGETTYKVSGYNAVYPGGKVAITTEHFWEQGLYAFYDANHNFISGQKANSGGTVTKLYNAIVDVPGNAEYIVIGYLYQSAFPEPFLYVAQPQTINPTKKWAGKKWTIIGDSLSAYNGRTSVHYFDYIAEYTGIGINNMGVSGTGYAKETSNFMTKASEVALDSDIITIFGSGNDATAGKDLGQATDTGTDTIAGCINTALDNIKARLPVVPLGIITPTPWQNNMPYNNGWMESYSNLIVEICKRRSIPCLDLYHCYGLDPNDSAVRNAAYSNDGGDGVHPDETGHRIIASHFQNFLESLLLH